jgi:formiminoglutamase
MKILSYNSKSLAETGALDDSRLGYWVADKKIEEAHSLSHGIAIFGFADDTGIKNVGGRIGAAKGPEEIRKRLYKFTLGKPNLPIYDFGDLQPAASIEETLRLAAEFVTQIHKAGHVAIPLGGGHDFGFPQALGLLQAKKEAATVINIDAHLDVRPAHKIISSGSPWYLLNEHALFTKTKSKIVEFGIQEHCNAHCLQEYAQKHKFEIFWLPIIRKQKMTIPGQLEKILKKQVKQKDILISFDIDSVQWQFAPGCSAPQVSGFSQTEALEMALVAGKQKKVRSFGVFEVSPALDSDGRTATLAAHCISEFLRGKGCWK